MREAMELHYRYRPSSPSPASAAPSPLRPTSAFGTRQCRYSYRQDRSDAVEEEAEERERDEEAAAAANEQHQMTQTRSFGASRSPLSGLRASERRDVPSSPTRAAGRAESYGQDDTEYDMGEDSPGDTSSGSELSSDEEEEDEMDYYDQDAEELHMLPTRQAERRIPSISVVMSDTDYDLAEEGSGSRRGQGAAEASSSSSTTAAQESGRRIRTPQGQGAGGAPSKRRDVIFSAEDEEAQEEEQQQHQQQLGGQGKSGGRKEGRTPGMPQLSRFQSASRAA